MVNGQSQNSWFLLPRPNPAACLRLFCFPYAGGGAHIYQSWPKGLPSTVEVCALQLPGRGSRWNERPFTRLLPLVQTIARAIPPYLDRPFAFFGHSMGSLIAFELARELRMRYGLSPLYFFASSRAAPHVPDMKPKTHTLPDSEFKERIRSLNGTPPVLLDDAELMKLMFPVLRADFAIHETYVYTHGAPLDCPISAFGGLRDREVSRSELAGWRDQTRSSFTLRMFSGDHFFIQKETDALLQAISSDIYRTAVYETASTETPR